MELLSGLTGKAELLKTLQFKQTRRNHTVNRNIHANTFNATTVHPLIRQRVYLRTTEGNFATVNESSLADQVKMTLTAQDQVISNYSGRSHVPVTEL